MASPGGSFASSVPSRLSGSNLHFAGGDLFIGRAFVAKLAYADRLIAAADGRTEGPAGDRASGVEIAGAGFGIQRRTGRIFIAPGNCLPGTLRIRRARVGVGGLQIPASPDLKPPCIQRRDRENAVTALRAAGTADQPRTALYARPLRTPRPRICTRPRRRPRVSYVFLEPIQHFFHMLARSPRRAAPKWLASGKISRRAGTWRRWSSL